MRIRFDREACDGMLACIPKWDVFEQPAGEFKPVLRGAEEVEEKVYVLEVPEEFEEDAEACVDICPVNAIELVEDSDS